MADHLGDVVIALEQISESELAGETPFIHAEKGEIGRIVGRDGPEILTVTWRRRGSTTDVHRDQVRLQPRLAPLRAVG